MERGKAKAVKVYLYGVSRTLVTFGRVIVMVIRAYMASYGFNFHLSKSENV